jgi:hypothetical protein
MKLSDKEADLLLEIFTCYGERIGEDTKVLDRYFGIETRDKLYKDLLNLQEKLTKELF